MQENHKMRKFAEAYYKKSDELYPCTATAMGIHDYDHKMDDLSPEAIQESLKMHRDYAEEIEKFDFDKLDDEEKIMYHIVNSNLKATFRDIERRKVYENDPGIYADLANSTIFMMLIRNYAPMEDRLRNIISRLNRIPAIFEAAKKNLKNPPKVYVDMTLDSLKGSGSLMQGTLPGLAEKYFDSCFNCLINFI